MKKERYFTVVIGICLSLNLQAQKIIEFAGYYTSLNTYVLTEYEDAILIKNRKPADSFYANILTTATSDSIQLVHTLTFDYYGKSTTITKYKSIKNDDNSQVNSIQQQKVGANWKVVRLNDLNQAEYVIKYIHTDTFKSFYIGAKSRNDKLNRLKASVRGRDGSLDLTKLYQVMQENKEYMQSFSDY